jgi:hypothetical protein
MASQSYTEESQSLSMLDDLIFLSTFDGLTESVPYSFPDPTRSMEGDSPDVTGLQVGSCLLEHLFLLIVISI